MSVCIVHDGTVLVVAAQVGVGPTRTRSTQHEVEVCYLKLDVLAEDSNAISDLLILLLIGVRMYIRLLHAMRY